MTASKLPPAALPTLAVLASLVSQNIGAALAKSLFPVIGANGVTALRVGLAALVLLALYRPWHRRLTRRALLDVALYGAMLGLMNLLIYQAFARIPIGIAVAIEVTGPLLIVLIGSRGIRDFLWFALAATGLALILPLHGFSAALDPIGLTFAVGAAACWALYIVFGKRSAETRGGVALGMVAASLVTAPFGLWEAGGSLFAPSVLAAGLAVAVLSSALPYTAEIAALRRLPAHVFGILVSAAPAIAAFAGWAVLGEELTMTQWIALVLIIMASAGSAAQVRPGATPPVS